MATQLGQAYIQIMPSAKGIKSNIEKEMGGEVTEAGNSAGKKMGGSLVSTLGKVVVAAGIGKMISSALNAGGELQQNLGGTEAVFGTFANNVQTTAKDAYKNMGLSASDYMATANQMGSLFQGSGVDQQKSLDLTSNAMQRAADVASVMGVDTSMAMDSIAGAAKGNFSMMDNLGVAMNATSIEAYALEKGINFDWKTASNAEKSEVAMKMFMDRTSQYAGNFAKESEETFSGSLGAMKSSFQDMLATLSTGGDLGPALENMANTVVTFAQNLIPMITSVLTQLPTIIVNLIANTGPQLMTAGIQAIANIASGIGATLPTLIPLLIDGLLNMVQALVDNIPMLIDGGLQLITGLAQGILNAIPILLEKAPIIINDLVNALTTMIPVIIETGVKLLVALIKDLPAIITAILTAVPKIIDNLINALVGMIPLIIDAGVELLVALIENLPAVLIALVGAMPKIIDSIVNTLLNNIPLIINAGVQLLTALIQNLPLIISSLVGAMPQIITSLIQALKRGISGFKDIGKELFRGLGEGIKSVAGEIVRTAIDAAKKVVDGIKKFFGIKSPSRMFMEIGAYLDEGLAEGIEDNMKPVSKAMDNLGGLTSKSFESDLAFNATSSTSGLSASVSSDINSKTGEANGNNNDNLLRAILKALTNMQIVLDTGVLVGEVSDEMNFRTQQRLGGVGVV